jgi:hypothetical protein
VKPNRQDKVKSSGKPDYWRRDVVAFRKALHIHMQRCGDTLERLLSAAADVGLRIHEQSITGWVRAKAAPRSRKAFEFLAWLERRYGLPEDYFRTELYGKADTYLNIALRNRTGHARTQLRWHLPDDFDQRSAEDRQKIVRWIEDNILPCSTDYGKYLKKVCNEPFSLRFPDVVVKGKRRRKEPRSDRQFDSNLIDAPPRLAAQVADSPLGEYRKIADEVLRRMPDQEQQPKAAAEAVRAYLLLRFGMHLGLRQRNLRELLVCFRGDNPRGERKLEELGCGEIRWCKANGGWQVFIPSSAFKNARSSFFTGNPFSLMLPDLEALYSFIDAYLNRHRPLLLAHAKDPETFFIKTVRPFTKTAAFYNNHFYRTWRETIQRYGIHNPYTGRGVIEGLLPHGPHGARDVLATHVLKQTGSYDLASYAIQDTPRMVAGHYGRFLPEDKAAQAAKILNRIWMPDGGAGITQDRFELVRSTVFVRPRPYLDRG